MRIIYIVLLCFVALSGKTIEDSSTSLKIVQPFDKTRYIGENSTFIIDTTFNLVDTIVIKQDNNLTTEVKVNSTKKTYCKTIKLHTAQNSISVSSYKNGKLVNTIERDLYFLSELFEGVDEDEAEDYKLRYLHNDKNEEKCKSCHNMKSNIPTNGEAFEDVSKTTCYECHKGMINTKNTHAPNPIAKTCTSCHETVKKWTESKYTHGPVNDGRCERCHNPHGSDNEFFLRKPIWDLCVTCHAEKADGKHIVSSFVFSRNSGGHPTKDRKDPARQGRDFYCSSCHNPHGSSGVFLLRMKGSLSFGVCNRCHKK